MIWEVTSFLILVLGASAADYYATTSAPPKPQLWLGTWLSTGEGSPGCLSGQPDDHDQADQMSLLPGWLDIERSYENTKTYEKAPMCRHSRGGAVCELVAGLQSDLRILYLDSGHKLYVFYEIISRYNQPGFESIQANDTHLHVTYDTKGVYGAQYFKRAPV
ncbi:hypothetical protein BV898_09422 [Hypsibius exemplaris]|uniref:Lipocalin/cytosolic fatty-acid binding domain-containing protein n=1 Tax=Hypsibius exemplaris TaxID=2072580 RepID=A0A1W0WMI8_HYPEX|nr:hypothetical protein BV898_09422 [Hypsibius exemplaris]